VGDYLWKIDPVTARAERLDFGKILGKGAENETTFDLKGVMGMGSTAKVIWGVGEGSLWIPIDNPPDSAWVLRIDARSGKRLAAVKVKPGVRELAVGGGKVWLLGDSPKIETIDAATNKAKVFATLPASPSFCAFNEKPCLTADDDAAWVLLDSSGRVARIDAKSGKVSTHRLDVRYGLSGE
jgi:hypothetical protein